MHVRAHRPPQTLNATLLDFCLYVSACAGVCGQSIWSPGVQVPRVLLAVTSGSRGAYIICYEAWMSSSNYGKTQGPIYSPCSHGYHNINTLKAIKVSLNNLQFLKYSLSLCTSLGGGGFLEKDTWFSLDESHGSP